MSTSKKNLNSLIKIYFKKIKEIQLKQENFKFIKENKRENPEEPLKKLEFNEWKSYLTNLLNKREDEKANGKLKLHLDFD